MLKQFLKIVIIASFVIFVFGQEGKNFTATLEISVSKSNFLTHEPVWVKSRIENRGKIGPRVSSMKYENWVVRDSEGTEYKKSFFVSYSNIPPMKPGEVYEDEVNMISLMVHPDNFGKGTEYGDYWLPGSYQIQRVWQERGYDPLSSNILEITISAPTGDEKRAMDLLREGIKLEHKNEDLADKKYWELVEKYPNSVYVDITLNKIRLNYYYPSSIQDMEKGMMVGKKLLEQYPESKYRKHAFYLIRKYYREKCDSIGAKEYFKNLNNTTKSSSLKKRLEIIIKQIDDGKL